MEVLGKWYDKYCSCLVAIGKDASGYYLLNIFNGSSDMVKSRKLKMSSATVFFAVGSSTGDHYVLMSNGMLAVGDRDGIIDYLPKR